MRIFVIVLDGVGIGALPDAEKFGDEGADTLGHIAETATLHLPFMTSVGLGNIRSFAGIDPMPAPHGAFGRLEQHSAGKDTTTGHWELMGLVTRQPFPTYPDGFPPEVVQQLAAVCGRQMLGNKPASGTQIIAELGAEHLRTGALILYTSADSVCQIAAHERVVTVEELYRCCAQAREVLRGPHAVARVIARPFHGEPGAFTRTAHRRDFSLPPHGPTALDILAADGVKVTGVGKIGEIFTGRGLTSSVYPHGNEATLDAVTDIIKEPGQGSELVLVNLPDFDSLYGHRNDVYGFARALEAVDRRLFVIAELLPPGDVLLLTGDHGCDPCLPGTDHTREYTPLLATGGPVVAGTALGTRSFADLGATITKMLAAGEKTVDGCSFAAILKGG